ncbi:pitrilysin family protein [Marivita sp.]|jgi:zinc protease|uniref:M16 family metallopeptidase n=1 Tax=Marivita sp. TaxID=2003365 RepID=UPI0026387A2E|nr:pitrilysin family protein [Marivita sp.]
MRRLMALTGALVFATAPLLAQTIEDQVTTFQLENGMDVVVIEDHRAPAVVHMVWYRAGSADEQPGVSGVAHFLEHLLFKGTEKLAPGEFSEIVKANGGTDNAFTSFDYTAYFQRVAADRLGLMMEMEADRMKNIQLDREDILTERDVIIEERNQRVENDPGSLFREQRMAAQYLNHPYGTPIIGWRHEMVNLDLDDALAYYRQFYSPNNAVLVVAGDVLPDDVLALAQEHYGPIPRNEALPERVRPSEPPQMAERRISFSDPRVAQPYVMRTYLAPERDSGDQRKAAALTLLSEVLGGSQTAVLPQKLQFEEKRAVYAGAFYSGLSLDDTTFGVVNVPAQGVTLEEAEADMDRVIAEFMETGVDPVQLDRIKFQLRAQQVYELDSSNSLANRYGAALTSGLTIEDVHEWPRILQSITPEEIIAAAQEVFDRDNAVTGFLRTAQEVTQ